MANGFSVQFDLLAEILLCRGGLMLSSRSRKKLRTSLLLGTALVLTAILAYGGYRVGYKRMWPAHLARKAEKFLSDGNVRNAILTAQRAAQIEPANVSACRTLAAA